MTGPNFDINCEQETAMLNFMKSRMAANTNGQISTADAIAKSGSGELTVIDVRDITEVRQSGKAEGALHISLMMLQHHADPRSSEFHAELDLEKPVAIYCATGARSGMAVRMMRKLGFQTVYNLGGLSNWASAGGKIVA